MQLGKYDSGARTCCTVRGRNKDRRQTRSLQWGGLIPGGNSDEPLAAFFCDGTNAPFAEAEANDASKSALPIVGRGARASPAAACTALGPGWSR
jgi:hypothetical protein